MAVARWERGPPLHAERWATDGHDWRRSLFPILILNMRSAMNRIKLCPGGFAASLMVLVAASAVAQGTGAGEWTMAGRTYDLQRYSPLTQISRANVKNLKASWSFSTGVLSGHEGNPLVINNVMYVHSAFPNLVFALDLTKPGAPMIWRNQPAQPPEAKAIACCDLVNRGLAYHAGTNRLFIELLQGDLLALDAKTGKQVWRVPNADYKTGSTMTNAPIVIKDLVIAGISGGEFGVRGRVTAYDVNTGKEVWRGYSTGPDADVKIVGDANPNYPTHRGKELGVSTGHGDEGQSGGGTTWKKNTEGICPAAIGFKDQQPSAYSPMTKLFYVPTNNICMDYEGVDVKYSAGQWYVGAIVRMYPGPDQIRGAFVAWDPTTGTKKWEIKENLAAYGGALTTAGGIVFYGTMEGWLKAVDANTGTELWKFKTPSGIIGNPMTYLGPDGKQYVAVLSGVGGWAGAGVALGISPEDPTAALGAIGAFGDYTSISNAGGTLMVFALP